MAWTITVLVNHPYPQQIQVQPPNLPPSLSLQRIRVDARSIRGRDSINERWTAAEFLFIPQAAGLLKVGPFQIIGQGKRTATAEITRTIRPSAVANPSNRPSLVWEAVPRQLKIGEQGEFTLRIRNKDPRKPIPEVQLYRQKLPLNAILEEFTPSQAERNTGIVLRIRLIPLEGSEVSLSSGYLPYEGYALQVPAVRIPISAAALPAPPPPSALNEPSATSAGTPFPDLPPESLLFKADYNGTIRKARSLWEADKKTEALAFIRRCERENLSGPLLPPLRRKLENALGIAFSPDEAWRPKLLLIPFLISGIALVIIPLILWLLSCYRSRKTPAPSPDSPVNPYFYAKIPYDPPKAGVTSKSLRGYIVSFFCGVVLCGIVLYLSSPLSSNTFSVVREAVTAGLVPDVNAGESAYFAPGEAVKIRLVAGIWVYAETGDGRSGWVRRDSIIF
ncbi:MAG: hypothetical protein LBP76_12135 [Treponema sp.]|nr:hypothetical protein [Treponema sp.]